MTRLGHRLLILVLAEGMLLFAVHAVAALSVAGSERYLLAGTATGLALAILWIWSDWTLLVTTEALAIILALGMQIIPHGGVRTVPTVGVVPQPTVTVALSPAGAIALTIATVCLASLCGWLLAARRTPWPVVALAGSMLLVRADVSRVYEDRFPLFLAAAVALVVIIYSPTARRLWLAIPAALLALALVAASWQLPVARHALSLSWNDPLSGLASGGAPALVQNQLPLQGGFHPSNRPVMLASASPREPHPYWRMSIFETYDGHGWSMDATSGRIVASQDWLTANADGYGDTIFTTIRLLQPAQTLVSAGEPLLASIPSEAIYAPGEVSPTQVQALAALPSGTGYEVAGTLDAAPIEASQERKADLQLPGEPARVAALARRIVRPYSDDIHRSLAIETYLRDSGLFTYDANAGSPADGDAVDTFLFESRRGYCNQFASAMVVLARSAGIPARLVSGYATGTPEGPGFLVSERDAHSWAEVYVDGTWAQLDPTPGFDAVPAPAPGLPFLHSIAPPVATPAPPGTVRTGPATRPTPAPTHPSEGPANARAGKAPVPPAPLIGGIAAGAMLLLGSIAYAVRPRSLDTLYRGLVRAAPRRYGRLEPGETPLEFAERFRAAPEEYEDMTLLAALYARRRYAGRPPTAEELRDARRAWFRLRRRWLLGLVARRLR